jgi:hypothetical protein
MGDFMIQETQELGVPITHMNMKDTITFRSSTNSEMLRISPDGFYVRGVRIQQDEREAEMVYKTFHQWLTWATLNRSF